MSDMSAPLEWNMPPGVPAPGATVPGAAPAPAPTAAGRPAVEPDKIASQPFLWPMPPYASYPAPAPQTDPMPCEIVGRNDKRTTGRLTFFVPEEGVAHVQLPPARTTLPLRFEQFRSITLLTPVKPLALPPGDPHASLLSRREPTDYDLTLQGGTELHGSTVGYLEDEYGVFLFPPVPDAGGEPASDGSVLRVFIPRASYTRFEIGSRIGELLVDQHSATIAQVDEAVGLQQHLRGQKVGDILVSRQLVSPEQLLEAIDRQGKMPMVRIGEALMSLGMIGEAQLKDALAQQKNDRSVPLGELLVRMQVVSREDLQLALSRKMGYPLVDVAAFPVEVEALKKLGAAVATRLNILPLLIRDSRLIVAMDDPSRRRSAVDEVEFSAQMKVVPVLGQSGAIEATIPMAYERIGVAGSGLLAKSVGEPVESEQQNSGKLVASLEREQMERAGLEDDERPIEQSDNSLVRLLNTMIIEAHKDGVSDIHIESYPGREKIRVRFRKDGLMRTYLELPPNYRSALIARVKIMCDLDISERRKPQDGKINFAKFSPQHKLELRVATIPTNNNLEDVVMRILASAKPLPLDRLGLSENNLAWLKTAIERPYGMVLCVGPTGSGKTTTLHSALSYINVPERKIWTAEDPVEITQPGLRQVQINPKIDWTFGKALRAFLRADPDVIMVGEIRDNETAGMAVEASLTGHLVMSTLHTNSAPETVTRLLDMGLDPFNFGDSLLAVLAQRLVRRLCPECRKSRPATPAETDELLADYLHGFGAEGVGVKREAVLEGWLHKHGQGGRLMRHASAGCAACAQTGFKGRAGLHELMVVSRELRHLIQTGARAEALQHCALRQGMRTLRHDGIDKVVAGVTTIEEVRATSNV